MTSTLVTIILLLVIFGLLLSTFLSLKSTSKEITQGKDCQLALALQKTAKQIPGITYQNACKTIYIDLPQAKKRTIDSNKDISKEIAAKIMKTWDISNKGTLEGMWDDEGFKAFASSGCMVLYEFKLTYVESEPYYQKDLYQFMDDTVYKKVDGLSKKYIDYVQTAGGPGIVFMPEAVIITKDSGTSIPVLSFTDKQLEEGELYSISMVSPDRGYFQRVFSHVYLFNVAGSYDALKEYYIPSNKPNNILQFSTSSFAESVGCMRN